MAIAKVILNGETQMDVTKKTVTSATMLSGTTALKNDGTDITGNIASKSSSDLTVDGATVNVPSGYYSSAASKSVASGTAGTPTATKGTVSNHSVSVTPSVTNTTGYITGGTKNGTAVSVSASELVSGTKTITASGETDVTNYASASVAAGSATTPTTTIAANPTISVNDNGLITASVSGSKSVTPTVSAGYISSGTSGNVSVSGSNTKQLTTQGATTIAPSTTDQVAVSSGTYVTGDITVEGATLQEKTADPTGSVQEITPDGKTIYFSADVGETATRPSNSRYGTFTLPNELTTNETYNISGTITLKDGTYIDFYGLFVYGYTASPAFSWAGDTEISGALINGTTFYIELATGDANEVFTVTKKLEIYQGEEYFGLSKVTVNAVTTTNLTAENIAQGVTVKVGTASDDDSIASITGTHQGGNITVNSLSVTQNGTYTAPSGTAYSPVTVNVEGGSSSADKKQINFIDYDGTIVESYTSEEWANVSELPANPSHSGLVAQGWNWTKAQIDTQLSDMPDGDVWIGQMYITSSGKTEIDISLENPDSLSPYLTIPVNGSVTVDWGDGTSTDTVTGTSLTTLKYTGHEYASVGKYTISILVNSGSFCFFGSSSKGSVLSAYGTDSNRRYNREYSSTIESIRIGSGVTSIGTYAFQYCYALQSITIPSGVTSIEKTYAFSNCYALQSITLPSGVTSIGSYAFQNCYALQSVTLPSGVTSIGNFAFQNCYALQSVTLPSGVTSIGAYAFQYCYALQSITIPSGVTSIGTNEFTGCYVLQSVTLPSGVTSIGTNAFTNCYALQSVTLPSGVMSIGNYAFSNCYSLQPITIPSGVTSIGNYTFGNCYSVQSITIPSGVTSIGTNAFTNCYAVEEYHILPTTPPTLGGTNSFNGIVSGTVIYVPTESLEAYQTATNWSTYASYMQGE